jgi:hypothetical protein
LCEGLEFCGGEGPGPAHQHAKERAQGPQRSQVAVRTVDRDPAGFGYHCKIVEYTHQDPRGDIFRVQTRSFSQARAEILRPTGGSVSQTIVFRYEEIGDKLYCIRNIENKVMV